MGKWTLDYHDDVLRSKVKNLVSGAIKRSKLEKSQPTISYEAFVEELEEGDSFTTSLLEVLVKELAERRLRNNLADRRLISDTTAKSLRMLATPLHTYRDRGGRASTRRSINLTEYLTAPPEEMNMEEEEEDSDFTVAFNEAVPGLEGARVNSELYDAYLAPPLAAYNIPASLSLRSRPPSVPPSRLFAGGRGVTASDREPLVLDRPTRQSPIPDWLNGASSVSEPRRSPGSASGGAALTRQGSIRRPGRSRTVDFSDFTSRRRVELRHDTARDSHLSHSASAPNSNSTTPAIAPGQASQPSSSPRPRRFFPSLGATRRHEVHIPPPWSHEDNSDLNRLFFAEDSIAHSGESSTSTSRSASIVHGSSADRADERPRWILGSEEMDASLNRSRAAAPRLRRGGVRAPESMITPGESPIPSSESHWRASVHAVLEDAHLGRTGYDSDPRTHLPTPRSESPSIE